MAIEKTLSHIWLVVSMFNRVAGVNYYTIVEGSYMTSREAEKVKRSTLKRWPRIPCGVVRLSSTHLPEDVCIRRES